MAKKQKKGPQMMTEEPEEEFDLPEGLKLLQGGNGWGKKIGEWFKRNFSAVILPIIALVILGGGIYLYSQQKDQGLSLEEEDLTTGITIDINEEGAIKEQIPTEEKPLVIADKKEEETKEVKEEEEKKEDEKEIIGGPVVTLKTYEEAAAKGEGVTHLARKALKRYAATQGKNIKLTAEHKIYIEDYLQNRTGSQSLNPGDKLSFSENLIKEAIAEAGKLTSAQLQNLTQYAQLVPSLAY